MFGVWVPSEAAFKPTRVPFFFLPRLLLGLGAWGRLGVKGFRGSGLGFRV